jgi:hypothetical protein
MMTAQQEVFELMLKLRELRKQLQDKQNVETVLMEQLRTRGQDDFDDMLRAWNGHVAAASRKVSMLETMCAWLDDLLAEIPPECDGSIERNGAGHFVGLSTECCQNPLVHSVGMLIVGEASPYMNGGPRHVKRLPDIPFPLFGMLFTRDEQQQFIRVNDDWGENGLFGRRSKSWFADKQQTVLSDLADAKQHLYTCLDRMQSQLATRLAPSVLRKQLEVVRDDQSKLSADIKNVEERVEQVLTAY